MYEVDARGFSCPEPVMMTMDALKNHGSETIRVLVSSTNARDNIKELARRNKKTATVTAMGYDFEIIIE